MLAEEVCRSLEYDLFGLTAEYLPANCLFPGRRRGIALHNFRILSIAKCQCQRAFGLATSLSRC